MALRKKLGYNWKARQKQTKRSSKTLTTQADTANEGEKYPDDTNALILPGKKRLNSDVGVECAPKRKKLTSKQRKRLSKVIETKEKKTKRAALLDSLSSLALPESHMTCLHSSTSIGQVRTTNKQFCSTQNPTHFDKVAPLKQETASRWRKNRKRRKVREEKVRLDPHFKGPQNREEESGSDAAVTSSAENETGEDPAHLEETFLNTAGGMSVAIEDESVGSMDSEDVGGNASSRTELSEESERDAGISEVSKSGGGGERVRKPAVFIPLQRDPDVQAARLSLPILGEEQVIMEAISQHPVLILCGETGSGKTTQVPQFLYEAGYTHKGGVATLIGITEPRRVAAVSMSNRVAMETGLSNSVVSYQIRYEGNSTEQTRIKFMTDGVLLKEIERDFLLSRYSVIVIDEAHERSVFTDILIGLLSRIVPLREKKGDPLKLVIMSATLRVEDFTSNSYLFPSPPPVISIDSRQYPVTVHFNKRTPIDYLTEAYRKICKVHRMLKAGNILVFVTGQKEVHTLCRKLRQTFGGVGGACESGDGVKSEGVVAREEKKSCKSSVKTEIDLNDYPILPSSLDETVGMANYDEDEGSEEWSSEDEDIEEEEGRGPSHDSQLPLLVLPLYSLLSPQQQAKVFQAPPTGVRMCVVATNVAETSLTIPGVKYVIDTGKVKRRYYDKVTGVSTFQVCWTSKASANQRAGRAGRTEPGHCYRLYSSSVLHNEFEEFSPPEITRRPVDDLVLQMKALGIAKVTNFPFPTPPTAKTLIAAEELLMKLGALDRPPPHQIEPPTISSLGRIMTHFPLTPRYAKMLALGGQSGCMSYVIALVAALSVREVFAEGVGSFHGDEEEDEKRRRKLDRVYAIHRSWAGQGECQLLGDLMVLLRAVGASEFAGSTQRVCESSGLRHKAMLEIRKLRQQLTNAVNAVCPGNEVYLDPKMPPPNQEQARCLRQIVLTGLGNHVARKLPTHSLNAEDRKRFRHAYQSLLCSDPVFLHHSSSLYHVQPELVVFQEIVETKTLYMRTVSAVEEAWLPKLVPQYCTFSTPLDTPPPTYDTATGTVRCHMTCTFGNLSWSLSAQELPYPDSVDKYRLFAQFLLQGKVIPRLSEFTPHLLVSPVAMTRKWSKLHKQCEVLLNALLSFEVCSRGKLVETWAKEPKYLLKAFSLWIPESKHKQLSQIWPPACSEVDTIREPN